jgi:hypothetical protein
VVRSHAKRDSKEAMRTGLIGLAAAGCAILGLAGCGSGPAPGSADWTKACTAMGNIPGGTGATSTDFSAAFASMWSDGGSALGSLGYDALASDAQRVAAAMGCPAK